MDAHQRALLSFCFIVLLAVSGALATRESSIGRLARTGKTASGRRSITGWTAQRKLQGVDYASASAFASASSSIVKKPEVVVPKPIIKKPQVQVVKQPQIVKEPQIVKQPQVVVKKVFSPPPPAKKVIAIKKYG